MNWNGDYYLYIHTAEDDEIQFHVRSWGPEVGVIEGFKIIDCSEKKAIGNTFSPADLMNDDMDYCLFDL